MNDRPLIVGTGPTGLAAALFLSIKGVTPRIVDQAGGPAPESRALVVNPQALELLASAGVAEAMVAEGRPIRRTRFYSRWEEIAELEFGDVHPRYSLTALPQARIEAILAGALARRGVQPERGTRFVSFVRDGGGVSVKLARGGSVSETARAPLLLGADGAHSQVREALGFQFDGSAFPETWPLYDIALDDPLDLDSAHVSFVPDGLVFLLALRPGVWRVFANVPDPLHRLPKGAKPGETLWRSAFHISHRIASREANGRVALAGDAAHIHSPVAARGMNLGIEDAYVFAECAVEALGGDWRRIEEFGRARRRVHRKVVTRVRALSELARGRSPIVRALRGALIPAMTRFSPAAAAMRGLLTGLDHEVEAG